MSLPLARTLTALGKRRTVVAILATVVAFAVAGTTYGYAALNKDVTLTLDGQTEQVTAVGDTVGDILAAEGIEIDEHDVVAPSVDEAVVDGSAINVRFARELELTVDGEEQTHMVTSTSVIGALGEIGRPFRSSALSTSRDASIGREGLALEVITPKTVEVRLAGEKKTTETVTALTVRGALKKLGVTLDKHDEVSPAPSKKIANGDDIVFTDVRIAKKQVKGESVDYDTVTREDDSMYEGEDEVVREGTAGTRNVTYRLVFRNGELKNRSVLSQKVLRQPVDAIVAVGTKEEPAPTANFASGGTVWDSLAQCESGGNWAINTGNGYYGGLQFNASTWQAYGGTGLPHQHSRETQIAIATKLRDARGGYGAWPHCSSQLGLPR